MAEGPQTWQALLEYLSTWGYRRMLDATPGARRTAQPSEAVVRALRAAGWRSPEEVAADPFAGLAKVVTAMEQQGFRDIFLGTDPNAEEEERWECRFLGPDEVFGWGPTPLIAAQNAADEWQREAKRRAARSKA